VFNCPGNKNKNGQIGLHHSKKFLGICGGTLLSILATQEVEIERIMITGQSVLNVSKIPASWEVQVGLWTGSGRSKHVSPYLEIN
jgi:hypothetical protein